MKPTPLPPPPTFNHEFVATSGAADRPAAAFAPPVRAAAGCQIPPGYVLIERELAGRMLKRLQEMAKNERNELRRLPRHDVPLFLRPRDPVAEMLREWGAA